MSAAAAQVLASASGQKMQIPVEAGTEDPRWRRVFSLSCQLTVDLPLPGFKVTDYLALRVGSVIATQWRLAHDIPLRINGTLIGWAEFEGAGTKLAVRLTELA